MKLLALGTLICGCLFGFNQEALDGVVHDYARAWNEKGGVGFGAHFSENARFVNIFGMTFKGRQAIEDRHVEILQTFLKDSTLEITETEYMDVAPGVVVGQINWRVDNFKRPCCGPNQEGQVRKGIFTQVFLEKGDSYEIISSQNTMSQHYVK